MAEEKWLRAKEVADLLRVSLAQVYKLANHGEVPAHRFGGGWRFPAAGIERLARGSSTRSDGQTSEQ